MRKFIAYMIAGATGALLVLAVNRISSPAVVSTDPIHTEARLASYQAASSDAATDLAAETPTSFHSAAMKALPAVVKIQTLSNEVQTQYQDHPFGWFFGQPGMQAPRLGAGSGVIISSDGYIATNNHVIQDANDIEVTLHDNRTFKGQLVGVDERTDLAVIKIESEGLPTLDYGDSDDIRIGDWVLAIGNPFEYLTSTVTAGIVSAKGRNIDIIRQNEAIEAFIQTDAAVNPGNSGGALVNVDGELVGINTAIASQTGNYTGYSFAIPVNLVKKITNDLIQYGSYKRAMLGVAIRELDQTIEDTYGIKVRSGVFVNEVSGGGAAELAGILPMDVITAVDDRKVSNVAQLQEMIGTKQVGDMVEVNVIRKGQLLSIPVRLKE